MRQDVEDFGALAREVEDFGVLAREVEAKEAEGLWGWARHQQALGRAEVRAQRIGSAVLIDGGPGSVMTRAYGLGMEGPTTDAQIEAITDFFLSHGRTPRVELCSHADESWTHALRRRGYGVEGFKEVLTRRLRPDEPLDPPADLDIRRVEGDDEARRVAEAIARGFSGADEATDGDRALFVGLMTQPGASGYGLWCEGEPVAGGVMAVGEGRVALFAASTLPGWRRQGFQRALILARLDAARALGATLATVQARPGVPTRRNAARLGFEMAYTRVCLVLEAR